MRKSGWYRIVGQGQDEPEIAMYVDGTWMAVGYIGILDESDFEVKEFVMTLEGELVYHKPNEHDPLYNTSQEG